MVKFHQCTAIAGLLGLLTACTDDPSLIASATDSATDSATGDHDDTESTSTGEGPQSTTGTSISTAATEDPSETSTGTSTGDSSTGDDSTGDTTGEETTGDDGVPIPGCGDHVVVVDKLNLGGHTAIKDFSDFCAHYDGVDGDLVLATPYHDDEPLPDFSGLECLRCVTGDLSIQHAGVKSLTGLDNLVRVGSLTLTVLPYLTDLQGLGSLEEITGPFLLRMDHWAYVPSELKSLAGLDSLLHIGELIIEYSDALESLTGLESVTEIGALELRDLPLLADLDGLLGLQSLTSLSITYNDTLADLYGLINVDTPIKNLYLWDNPALLDLVGAPPLAPFATLSLGDLPAIVDLWGLPPLPSDLTHVYLD